MKKPSVWFYVGLFGGPFIIAGYAMLTRRFPSIEFTVVICCSLGAIAALPRLVLQAKKEAVPAKRSDWIGYAVIALFCIVVYLIAREVVT